MSTTPIQSGSNPDEKRPTARIVVRPSADGGADAENQTLRIGDTAPASPAAGADNAAEPNRAGSIFDQYAVLDRIGDGGMGVVFLARDRRLGRFAAIKRLNRKARENASLCERFLQEAISVAALNHGNIVRIYGLGEDDDGAYLVMEYIGGPGEPENHGVAPPLTLEQAVSRDGQMPLPDAVELALKLCRAIAHAHAQGVIHRDLKPSNVLLDAAREPKIVDFGLARLRQAAGENKLTVPGEKLLSLGYGAPEQEQDASVSDERADIYGLGGILYFMLTGRNPRYFREQELPPGVREALTKALATDREQRWPNTAAFMDALSALQNRTHVEKPAPKTTWHCKWCDTLNALTTRHCAACGWDGTEECPECGADIFTGVQFCGACGADVRAHTTLNLTLFRIKRVFEKHRYEDVPALATRALGLDPAGPAGRKILEEVRELQSGASRALTRRDLLKEQIPLEFRAENYERAEDFIREYRVLSGNAQAFAEELERLPASRARRECQRARRAMRNGEWARARRICDTLLAQPGGRTPESEELSKSLRVRRNLFRAFRALLVLAVAALLYLLHAPLLPETPRAPLKPAVWVYKRVPPALTVARAYTGWLDGLRGAEKSATNTPPRAVAGPPEPPVTEPPEETPEVAALRDAHQARLAEIEAERALFESTWPARYARELEALMERHRADYRAETAYDNWSAVEAESIQFARTRRVSPASSRDHFELAALKSRMAQYTGEQQRDLAQKTTAACQLHTAELDALLRAAMGENRMERAKQINEEIQRVKSDPLLARAAAVLAAGGLPSTLHPAAGWHAETIGKVRSEFNRQLVALDAESAENRAKWPVKYVDDLYLMARRAQGAGETDDWRAVQLELDRFEAARELRPADVVPGHDSLAALQTRHLALLQGYREARARGVAGLVEKCAAQLAEAARQPGRGENAEAAAAVSAEIQRLKNHPEFLAAAQLLSPAGE